MVPAELHPRMIARRGHRGFAGEPEPVRCRSAHGRDRDKCRPEFEAYKACKKAEVKARKDKSFF